MIDLDTLVFVVISLHDGDGVLVLFEDVRGMVFLHIEHGLVRLVQHVLGFVVLEIIIMAKEVLLVIQLGLTDAFKVV